MTRRRRVGRKGRKRRRDDRAPGWHLKLETFKRSALAHSPKIITREIRGWELHLRYKEDEPEPWALTAHPAANPEWSWLMKVADYLGIPEDERPEKMPKGQRAVISWSWIMPGPAPSPLPEPKESA